MSNVTAMTFTFDFHITAQLKLFFIRKDHRQIQYMIHSSQACAAVTRCRNQSSLVLMTTYVS